MKRLHGLYILDSETYDLVYGPQERQAIARYVDMIAPQQTRQSIVDNVHLLESVDVIFSGWAPPVFDDAFFDKAPNLEAIFYAAGGLNSEAAERRGILVTNAHLANSRPVAEYSLATILFCLKHGWRLSRELHSEQRFIQRNAAPGGYHATVGLISLGAIARILLPLLEPFDLKVLVYDPYLAQSEAEELGVELVSLAELFQRSDVVSLHSPETVETRAMINKSLLAGMKPGATFINTARGPIVRQEELVEVARARKDLQFVLDVTSPEVLPAGHELYSLPNVILTPHIAGSAGGECRRLGRCMVEELERYIAGKPLKWACTSRPGVGSARPAISIKNTSRTGVRTIPTNAVAG